MPAYMIVTAVIRDRDAFIAGYGRAAAALVERFGGRYVLRGPGAQLLEGGWGDGASMAISEWPDTAALAFWNSPEYAEARRLREGIADVQVRLIEAARIAEVRSLRSSPSRGEGQLAQRAGRGSERSARLSPSPRRVPRLPLCP